MFLHGAVEYTALFDGNQTSCVDTDQFLTLKERYVIIKLNVTESRGDVFTVVYGNAIYCNMEKVTRLREQCSHSLGQV